jgi:hypothetical protein
MRGALIYVTPAEVVGEVSSPHTIGDERAVCNDSIANDRDLQ